MRRTLGLLPTCAPLVLGLASIFLIEAGSSTALALNENCSSCHLQRVADLAASSHRALTCEVCHEGAASHSGDPSVKPKVHFTLEVCAACHPSQYGTYTYGDDWKTKYGGSPLRWSKLSDFANYNDIIDGYGFTKEYNEERSHNVMLKDHFDVSRGKKETCLQCKSTAVAYYWDSGKTRVVRNETVVKAGHMTQPITVPAGTSVSMRTDRSAPRPYNHEAQVLVTLPDGTRYASFDEPGAVKDGLWTWAALYALTVNEQTAGSPTIDSGNGCDHCHDPHKVARDASSNGLVGFRIIRKSLIDAIGRRGINPYDPVSSRSFNGDAPLTLDESIALCGQCHVEYVCGNSSIDGIDRDFFPWAKASDLESEYAGEFPGYGPYAGMKYVQDWVHGSGALASPNGPANGISYLAPAPIKEELIKSQHPEAETYWGSRHYGNGAQCFLCHMPKVTRTSDGTQFTSHWLASPLKYMTPAPAAAFASRFGVELINGGIISPCGACHGGTLARMKGKAERIQDDTYTSALVVQSALMQSLTAIRRAKEAQAAGRTVNQALLDAAADEHRAAHVRWENLVVSENSMGFHNPTEVSGELTTALSLAQAARTDAQNATPASCLADVIPPALSGVVAPGTLWPPNHRLVDVAASVTAVDDCTSAAALRTILSGVASSEPDDAAGDLDGATLSDIREAQTSTPDFRAKLRAERSSAGSGRTYTMTYSATDLAGNATALPLTVFVPNNVAGVTEPILIDAAQGPGGTLLRWSAAPGAVRYNVIRGQIGNVAGTLDAFDLGPVTCIESGSTDTTTEGYEDPTTPVPGGVFFYLVEYDDGTRSGYGTESAVKPRSPFAGDCP